MVLYSSTTHGYRACCLPLFLNDTSESTPALQLDWTNGKKRPETDPPTQLNSQIRIKLTVTVIVIALITRDRSSKFWMKIFGVSFLVNFLAMYTTFRCRISHKPIIANGFAAIVTDAESPLVNSD